MEKRVEKKYPILSYRGLAERYRSSLLRKIVSEPMGLIGLILVTIIILIAIFAPFLAPHDPLDIDVLNRLSDSSSTYLLGTDHLGRDLLSRLIYGSRIALLVALPAIIIGLIMGLVTGIIAGYSSERVNNGLVILFDIVRSIPALIFAITIIALTGPNLIILPIVMGVTRFPAYGRLIRAQTMRVRENEYIMASKALGTPTALIMFRHILPNVVGPLFIQAAMDIPVMITFEAGLSFLGLGVPPPTPSWGAILRNGYSYIRTAPEMVIYGGIVLILATLGFTLFGEILRDVLDPKLSRDRGM